MRLQQKYYLGDGDNYFIYRSDKYNEDTIRADLFNKDGNIIDKLLVKGGIVAARYSHNDVINIFELKVSLIFQ